MDPFIRQLLAQPRLDAATEAQLVDDMRSGDLSARDRLITAGLRAVALQALMLGARDEALRDAVQAGTVGLISAVDRFETGRGTRLATYAWSWIRGAILAELSSNEDLPAESGSAVDPADESWMWLDGLEGSLQLIVRLRYGLDPGTAPLPRKQVASQLGIAESAVRRLEREAVRQLANRVDKVSTRASMTSAAVPHSSIGRAFDC